MFDPLQIYTAYLASRSSLLLQNLWIKFKVDVFDPLQIYTAYLASRSSLLHQLVRFLKNSNNFRLVLQPVHILITVSITSLQNLDELLIQSFDGCQKTSTNLVRGNVQLLILFKDMLSGGNVVSLLLKQIE